MGKLFVLLLNIGFISAVLGNCTVEEAIKYYPRIINEFRSDIVTRLSVYTDNHFVISSLSLWTMLASISFSAAVETLEELDGVLRMHPQPCISRNFIETVKGMMSEANKEDGIIFERSSTIFADRSLSFRDSFRQEIESAGVTKLQEMDIGNLDEYAADINSFVKSETGGVIDDIVTPMDLVAAQVLFLDALCFKGKWKYQLMTQYSQPTPFYGSLGKRIGDVHLVYGKLQLNMTDVPQMNATVLEMPYDNDRFSMLFILPDKGVHLWRVIENLKFFNLHTIFIRFELQHVTVKIPRFQISAASNLKHTLIDMGLKCIFGPGAEFPGMAERSLYVTNVIQKVTVEVTEEGSITSASGPTSTSDGYKINTLFETNRPFVYMIVDKYREIALFTGAYSMPMIY